MRRRASFLVVTFAVATIAVACGRASQREIDSALGITPTATVSAEQIASSTAAALAQASAAASGGGGSGSPAAVAITGDVIQGRSVFQFNCQQCHRPDGAGRGPSLQGPTSPAVALSDEQVRDLLRNGTNHSPPGPYETFEINDQRLNDLIAYLRSIAT